MSFDIWCLVFDRLTPVEIFWCFGILVIAGFWSQFDDCYACFACWVAKKIFIF